MLKVISWTKSAKTPLAQAKYVARIREQDAPETALEMTNEQGHTLRAGEIEAEIRSWGLMQDADNLSPPARNVGFAERMAMPANKRLHRRQAAHLVFSIPGNAKADAERLDRAVRMGLAETFGEGWFRYLYTIHADHSDHPHAHIVVKAQSEEFQNCAGERKTRQLRLGPRELEAIRHVLTVYAQEQGLQVVATRREDREDLRAEILAGRAPLHDNKKLHQSGWRMRQGHALKRQAPQWYAVYGLDYERRRAAGIETPAPKATPPDASRGRVGGPLAGLIGRLMDGWRAMPRITFSDEPCASSVDPRSKEDLQGLEDSRKRLQIPGERILEHFAVTHRDPVAALESFRDLSREAPQLALWAAKHHPITFGEPTGQQGLKLTRRDLGHLTQEREHERLQQRPDPILAGEHARLREAIDQKRAAARSSRAAKEVMRSLSGLADRLQHDAASDPKLGEGAARVRELSKGYELLADMPAPRLSHERRASPEAREVNKAQRYKMLEEELTRRDRAREKHRARERSGEGLER